MGTFSEEQLAGEIKGLGTRLEALENARQPQIGDWYEWLPTIFTYQASNVINVDSNYDVEKFFQLGTKIRLTQASTAKYFYVSNVDMTNNRITVNAGDDYTYTNNTITAFAMGQTADPLGFPGVFEWSPSLTYYDSADVNSVTDACYFRMGGGVISFWCNIDFSLVGGGFIEYVEGTFPFDLPLAEESDVFFPVVSTISMGASMIRGKTEDDGETFYFRVNGDHGYSYCTLDAEWSVPLEL